MAVTCYGCRRNEVENKGQICDPCIARGLAASKTSQVNVKHNIDPYTALKKSLGVLDAEQRLIRRQLTQPHLVDDRLTINKQITEVAKAIEKVAYTMLKYEQAGQSAVKNMSREQQIETIVKWFSNLPSEGKRKLITLLTQAYNEGKRTA